MAKGNSTTPAAIPTTYKGIKLKSRLEAQCAFMLDSIGARWEYEPESLMLGSGTTYTPDFFLPDMGAVIECRGYETVRGEAQIVGFRDLTVAGQSFIHGTKISKYVVIKNLAVSVYSGLVPLPQCESCLLTLCALCRRWSFSSFGECNCSACGAEPRTIVKAFCVQCVHGKLCLNLRESEDWFRMGAVEP